ncbi:MAG: D-tyrosyl-tRNA(Tyr) deacylase [Magnetococcales bacterium]|nr:D-tyrosyl-tRNA(Tyr) deacylase [Magnetococcales bacterium]
MRALIQRVSQANVVVGDQEVARIERGLLVFLAVEKGDGPEQMERMVRKVAGLRIFPDEEGRMNRDVAAIGGAVLVVSQFTLAAELGRGYRPSFTRAEDPLPAKEKYLEFVAALRQRGLPVAEGVFAADMAVSLVNDGPVTIWLDYPPGDGLP